MPTNLTDSSSFDTVTGPVGADIRNAASVRSALQTVANRTRFLFDRTDALADFAALKAISPADGLVRLVKSKGFYVFDVASVATEFLPFVVAPTAGAGRWLKADYSAFEQLVVQGASDFPVFETARSSVVVQAASDGVFYAPQWAHFPSNTPTYLQSGATAASAYITLARPHNGATLSSVTMRYRLAGSARAPGTLRLSFSMYQVPLSDPDGGALFLYSTTNEVPAYSTFGSWLSFTSSPDANNVIDTSLYAYVIRITEESGAGAIFGNHVGAFSFTYTNIADMRFP